MTRLTRTYSLEDDWRFFAEYARYEKATGGPDPHMTIPAESARGLSLEERIWRGGCYVAVYNAPYAEVLWRAWPWEHAAAASQEDLLVWLTEHWRRLSVHVARRTARRPDWMAQYLHGYADFARRLPHLLERTTALGPRARYEAVWDAALEVPRLGRYVGIKLLEFLRRTDVLDVALSDMRARDGYSPRGMLGILWPEHAQVAIKRNDADLLLLTDDLADRTRARLLADYGVALTWFEVQVLLCQYKQARKGKQHPGRSGDSQLGLMRHAEREWPDEPTDFWRARAAVHPPETLGEVQGWDGRRKELEGVLPRYGYTWSDLLYDYRATTDLEHPVRRVARLDGALTSAR